MPSAASTRAFRPADRTALSDVRRFLAQEAGDLSPDVLQELQLAVTEACANAIQHSGAKVITVTVTPLDSCLEVLVQDDGVYREELPVETDDRYGHRGMFLMVAMVDELSLRRGTPENQGTTVRLLKCSA